MSENQIGSESNLVIAVIGFGGAGKGTVSTWLSEQYGFMYEYSTSQAARTKIRLPGGHPRTDAQTPDEREAQRREWARFIYEYNNIDLDGIKLY